jgi:hypothetical protein
MSAGDRYRTIKVQSGAIDGAYIFACKIMRKQSDVVLGRPLCADVCRQGHNLCTANSFWKIPEGI